MAFPFGYRVLGIGVERPEDDRVERGRDLRADARGGRGAALPTRAAASDAVVSPLQARWPVSDSYRTRPRL